MGKKIIALLLFMICCLSLVIAVPGKVQAQELSWEQIGENGFGGQGTRAFSMTVFDESLYVGTLNKGGGGQVWRYDGGTGWTQVNADGFGEDGNQVVPSLGVFEGELYAGTTNQAKGCQVWRYDGGTDWTQVNQSGFDQGKAMVARVMAVFEEELYVGVRNDIDGAEVWRYDGGTDWTQVNADGFGITPSVNNKSVESLEVSDGNLYAGTWNEANGCQVWRYDGDANWTQVNEDGFGNASNWAIWSMVDYAGSLHAGTMNMANGCQVWRYDGDANWTQVNEDGFGNASNSMATSMTYFNGQLCVGTDNKTQGCQVWSSVGAPADENVVVNPLSTETETHSGEAGTSAWASWWLYAFLSLVAVTLLLALAYYLYLRHARGKE